MPPFCITENSVSYAFMKPFAENRKALHDYEPLERFEGGLLLTGQEVKSIRDGGAKLAGSYIKLLQGELWILGLHIAAYKKAGHLDGYDPDAKRKVLLRHQEIRSLTIKTQQKGLTLIPFSLYASDRRIKVSFALCRGKQAHDKRDALRERDVRRQTARFLRGRDE